MMTIMIQRYDIHDHHHLSDGFGQSDPLVMLIISEGLNDADDDNDGVEDDDDDIDCDEHDDHLSRSQ